MLKINIKNIIVILVSSILILWNNVYDNMIIKAILNIVIIVGNYKIIFKENIRKIIIKYIIIYGIMIMIELIYSNIISIIDLFKLTAKELTNGKIILSIITYTTGYIMIRIRIIRITIKRLIEIIDPITTIMNILYLLLTAIIVIGIFNVYNYEEKGSFEMIILIVIIFAILSALIIKTKTKEEILKESNKRLIDYNEKYGQFLDEYKIYKHNIKNKLKGMKVYGNKKINELIDDLLEEETTFSIKNNNLYKIPRGIKGIVAEKLYNDEINVIIENELKRDPFIKLKAKEFNKISEAIGICIDNAIEANEKMKERIITIELKEDKERIYIKIGNNYENNIDIERLGEKYYSTKKRGSGLGLFSIRRNELIKEHISIINDFYYIELQIKKHTIS